MSELQKCEFNNEFAPWTKGASFNAYWTYSFVNNSAFYASMPAYIRPFMQRFVQQWLWWYDGWVPYFHDQDKGILSTRLATALVNKIAGKVAGSRVMFKNAGKMKDIDGTNASRSRMIQWAKDTNFDKKIKQLCTYAAAGGTALLKINKNNDGELWVEPLRFDRFVPTIDGGTGKIRQVESTLLTLTDLKVDDYNQVYFLCERRYYGDYKALGSNEIKHDVPLVEYNIYRAVGSVVNGTFSLTKGRERVPFKTLDKKTRRSILDNYGTLLFDTPKLLPFKDLGCEIVTWTDGVSGLPELPFGDSVLASIITYLQEYDYLHSAMATDMYIGRGRVLLPTQMTNTTTVGGIANWDAGVDSMIYTKIPGMGLDDQKPLPLQFDLRSEQWKSIRNTLLESMAVNLGISPSTIGAFLNDSSARTAREVSTEENETAAYVAETRSTIEGPINKIIDTIRLYYGLPDEIEIRWSQANLSNPFMTTEMKASQVQAGLTSIEDAIADLNPDDDDEQIALKVQRAQDTFNNRNSAGLPFQDEEGGGLEALYGAQ